MAGELHHPLAIIYLLVFVLSVACLGFLGLFFKTFYSAFDYEGFTFLRKLFWAWAYFICAHVPGFLACEILTRPKYLIIEDIKYVTNQISKVLQ